MSSDLYNTELTERMSALDLTDRIEPGVWTGFVRGTGQSARRAMLRSASGIDLLGAVGPIVQDAFTGGTEAQDRYFYEHDEVYGRAMEHLTPKPDEIGIAGQITGELLGTLPFLLLAPGPTIGAMGVGETEELMRRGVPLSTAAKVGAVQAASMGLGIWVPILGRTLAQRMLVGGAGFNVVQGSIERAASRDILEKYPDIAAGYAPLDPAYLTLDILLGLAFGGMAHVHPGMRAEGAQLQERFTEWLRDAPEGTVQALATMRQAQHMAADSLPGRPVEPQDASFHVERVRQAIEQAARNEPIDVSNLPEATTEPLPEVQAERAENLQEIVRAAEEVRKDEGLPPAPEEPVAPRRLVPEDLTLVPVDQQARALGQAVENRLLDLRLTEQEARANAAIWEAFFETTSRKYGVRVADLLETYGIDVRRMSRADIEQLQPGALAQADRSGMARPGDEGYAPLRGQEHTPGEARRAAERAREPEDLPATVAGRRPAQGWVGATRASRAGRPIELFRGAAAALRPEDFRPDSLGWASDNPSAGLGVWFTPSRGEASTYGEATGAYLDIRNPKVVKVEELPGFNDVREAIAWREELRKQGHDSIVVTAKHLGGKTHIAVFEPDQVIPSAPTEPRPGETLFQGGERGMIKIGPETVIGLFEAADRSTFLHESSHLFLQITQDLARRGGAPLQALDDWSALSRWLGMEGGELTRAHQEKFATAFERYMAEGKAPSEELRSVFQQFRDWLLGIYKSLANIADELPDEIRGVMDRMLASQRQDPTPKAEGPPRAEAEPPPPPGEATLAGRPEARQGTDAYWREQMQAEGETAPPPPRLPLTDPVIARTVDRMLEAELGWEQIGGRRARADISTSSGQPNFTEWIPKSELWPGRPAKHLNEPQVRRAVEKARAGERLGKAEAATVDYLVEIANARRADIEAIGGPEEWNGTARALADEGLEPNTTNVQDADVVARAAEIDELGVERAAQKYENDDAAFMAEMRRIVGSRKERQAEPGESAPEGGQEGAGEAQGAEGAAQSDPLRDAALRYVEANPEQLISIGRDPEGNPVSKTLREYLDDELLAAKDAREDVRLIEAAATCLYGRG